MNGTTSKNTAPYVVAGIVTIFLIVIAYAMFFAPKVDQSKALVEKAAVAHTKNAALTAKAEGLAAIAKDLEPLKGQVAVFNGAFPAGAEQQNLIDTINGAASSAGVTITTLSPKVPAVAQDQAPAAPGASASQITQDGTSLPGPAPVGSGDPAAATAGGSGAQLGTVSVKIDANGSLDAVQAFIVKVESLQRPLVVRELQVDKLEKNYHVMLKGDTFMAAPLVAPEKSK